MGLFDAHDNFRDSLPGAAPTATIYNVDDIIREAEERKALIESIPDPRERGAKALEYVAKLAPAVGAFTGPQGAAIGAAVGALALAGSKAVRAGDLTPDDTAAIAGGIGDIITLFKRAKDAPQPDNANATTSTITAGGINAAAQARHAEPLPAGHHDTAHQHGGHHDHALPPGHHDTSNN